MERTIKNNIIFGVSYIGKEKIITSICWICMALFLYTAYAKIIDHTRFLTGLTRVNLISGYAVFISFAVPVVEIAVALLLLIPRTVKIGLYGFIVVMTLFTVYILCVMIMEKRLPCSCGGAIEKLSWGQHIWFNVTFICIAIVAIRLIKLITSFKT